MHQHVKVRLDLVQKVVAQELDEDAVCHRLGENEVLYRVMEERNISQSRKRKIKWICHILFTTCLIKPVLKGR
jgi:hypothetical protein